VLPGDAVEPDELIITDTLFDSLTRYGADGGIEDAAAIRWRDDEGARVWTFTLRGGATFAGAGGPPVTADDFVFAWTRAVVEGRAGYHLEEVEGYAELHSGAATTLTGVTAPDPRTLVVRLRQPFADFPAVVAHPAMGPLPRALYSADPAAYQQQPVGNGPFAATGWRRGDFLRATRFEDWANGPRPALTEVLFRFSDAETAYVAFQQERYDYAPLPAGALADAIQKYGRSEDGSSGPGVLDGPLGQLYFLGVNHTLPPFDRVEVRRALSLALDREQIAAAVREGNADPAVRAVPRALPQARLEPCAGCRYDPDEARALFAAAGVTELELWFNPGGGHEQVAGVVADQLAAVGITLQPRGQADEPFAAYLDRLRNDQAALFRFGWTLDHATLDDALTPLFASWLAGSPSAANYGRYAAPDVDALLAQARATRDAEERRLLYERAEDLALDRDQALVPLFTFRHSAVVSDRFEGFTLSPLGLPDLAQVRPAA
jgi:ABC-type transport system substrate-binding protein